MLPGRLPMSLSFSGKVCFCVHKGCTSRYVQSSPTEEPCSLRPPMTLIRREPLLLPPSIVGNIDAYRPGEQCALTSAWTNRQRKQDTD